MSLSNRRYRVIAVDPMTVLALFNLNQATPDRLHIAQFPDLPDGYEVENIAYDDVRRCFAVMVTHPTFPEIEVGGAVEFEQMTCSIVLSQYVRVRLQPAGEVAGA